MRKIGLVSDTHHYMDDAILQHFAGCDEIWHAGDFGTLAVANQLRNLKPLIGVYGNIDGPDVRNDYPEIKVWFCEGVKVLLMHIGGYPPKYNARSKALLQQHQPQLFICGHSHILKVLHDTNLNCIHINPGAAGKQGWHTVRTLVRFVIDGTDIKNLEIIELGNRG